MKGHGEKRSRTEERAIICLLQCSTIESAALACGVSDSTLWRWLQNPEFLAKYKDARRQAVSVAIAALQQATAQAVITLVDIVSNPVAPPGARVAAAKVILDTTFRAIETDDIQTSLDELKQAFETIRNEKGANCS